MTDPTIPLSPTPAVPQQAPKRPRRWPWVLAIAAALVVGVGAGVGTTVSTRTDNTSAVAPAPSTVTETVIETTTETVIETAPPVTETVTETIEPPPPAAPAQPDPSDGIGAGTYEVGVDLEPGQYKTTGPSPGDPVPSCYWARASDDSGDFEALITNEILEGPGSVTVNSGEFVTFDGSCAWTLQ